MRVVGDFYGLSLGFEGDPTRIGSILSFYFSIYAVLGLEAFFLFSMNLATKSRIFSLFEVKSATFFWL
jgi:hypothetical protein